MAGWMDKLIRKNRQEPETAAEPVLIAKNVRIDPRGKAIIPEGTREIGYQAFQKNSRLKKVVLASSVRKINSRAFAGCENLESVIFNEGLEIIEGNVFNGCSSLKKLVFPDSLKEVHAYAFYCSCLQEPVYNRRGDILHHWPCTRTDGSFTLPDKIKVLYEGAFFRNIFLEEAILPEGLERIDRRAFLETNIKRITIPSSVRRISEGAFWSCPELEQVNLLCPESALEQGAFRHCPNLKITIGGQEPDFELELFLQGKSLLAPPRQLALPDRDIWKEGRFVELASRCAAGDAASMMDFAGYFEGLGAEEFYSCAANFWRYRASVYGDARAKAWKQEWLKEHPRHLIPSPVGADMNCTASGRKLKALGFLFFEEDREYSLGKKDEKGIVEVSSWCGEEGPDEDGYGREELYDWWYLDEHLNPIPGAEMLHGYSHHERSAFDAAFDRQYRAAVRGIQK